MEIERKFLVPDLSLLPKPVRSCRIVQAYLRADREAVVRIRIIDAEAFLAVKGKSDASGCCREEFEYPIPKQDAEAMLSLCLPNRIEKTRLLIEHAGHRWEVDVFAAAHAGLVLAEIELSRVDESFVLPPWVGREVRGDTRYYNAYLINS